jgi:type II secretory pathway component PulJ
MSLAPTESHRSVPQGFSLLEVLLAMGLVSLVLIALMMAVDFQLRVVDTTRANVEEAQLARVLLHRIADDLRSAAVTAQAEASTEAASSSSSTDSTDSGQKATGGTDQQTTGQQGSQDSDSQNQQQSQQGQQTSETKTTQEDSTSTSSSSVGISGGTDCLRIAVNRPPRPDQWAKALATSDETTQDSQLGAIKSVVYFLSPEESSGSEDTTLSDQTTGKQAAGGLMRWEGDSLAASSTANLNLEELAQTGGKSLAPEVTSLNFRYLDGTEWAESWDSSESGKLPAAVEITLTLRPMRQSQQANSVLQTVFDTNTSDDSNSLIYRLVVDLPTAQAKASAGGSSTATEAEDDGMSDDAGQSSDTDKDADNDANNDTNQDSGTDGTSSNARSNRTGRNGGNARPDDTGKNGGDARPNDAGKDRGDARPNDTGRNGPPPGNSDGRANKETRR